MQSTVDSGRAAAAAPGDFHFCTNAWPERQRVEALREILGRQGMGVEIEPAPDQPLFFDARFRMWPGVGMFWSSYSPFFTSRTRQMLSDGRDDLVIQWGDGAAYGENMGREVVVERGNTAVASSAHLARFSLVAGTGTTLSIPRRVLETSVRDLDSRLARPIESNRDGFPLLVSYIEILRRQTSLTPELQRLAATHVHDLIAVVVGATRDAAHAAKRGGLRAALVASVSAHLDRNHNHGGITLDGVARRFGVSPRTIERAFAQQGTSFRDVAHESRLRLAHSMLTSPRYRAMRITELALAAGFGDLSYFNRSFRRRFGLTPSDVRAQRVAPDP